MVVTGFLRDLLDDCGARGGAGGQGGGRASGGSADEDDDDRRGASKHVVAAAGSRYVPECSAIGDGTDAKCDLEVSHSSFPAENQGRSSPAIPCKDGGVP